MENKKKDKEEQKVSGINYWMPIGMCLGCSFGIFLDNLAMGISLGMLFGVALGTIIDNKKKSDPSEDRPNNDNT